MKKKKIEITQVPGKEVPAQVLADSIIQIAKAAKLVTMGPLTRNCLATLIKDKTSISKENINRVLDALNDLEKDWLK